MKSNKIFLTFFVLAGALLPGVVAHSSEGLISKVLHRKSKLSPEAINWESQLREFQKGELSVDLCNRNLVLAQNLYKIDTKNQVALQFVTRCSLLSQEAPRNITDSTAQQAKVIFEKSKVLSIIPKVLEMAQVKDLIPILKEVEIKKDKDLSDYLMLNEIYEKLGEPEKQIQNLEEALKIQKESHTFDPQIILLLASKKISSGQKEGAENLLKEMLQQLLEQQSKIYLLAYVAALVYPLAVSMSLVVLIWLLGGVLAYRKIIAFQNWNEARISLPLMTALIPPLMAITFWKTGKALPIGVLSLILLIQLFMLLNPILKYIYGPLWNGFLKIFYFVFAGTPLAKVLNQLSTPTRVLISVTTLLVLGVIAPSIEDLDLKYLLILMGSLVLYATIGSLMTTFMRSRESLYVSLRWLGIVATFPFLISYIVANWSFLGAPLLLGQKPSEVAINGFASYLVFWGVSLFLALHLSKILSHAIVQPISEIIKKVKNIEKGHFRTQLDIFSRDEIGLLAAAVNRMGEGLEKRERIEKTFHKYVDSQVAERILAGDESELRIEGESVHAVVMFADIRGFTSMSEKNSPHEVVKILNQFFERMVRVVQEHQGVIDKFIGDNMMVVWGVPKSLEGAESLAARAALKMVEEVNRWNKENSKEGRSPLGVGIGLNAGLVVAGSIGSQDRMEYTVIGDTVNTAQRCESQAQKQQIIVTSEFFEKVKDEFNLSPLEPVKVKGKEGLQSWYTLLNSRDQSGETKKS